MKWTTKNKYKKCIFEENGLRQMHNLLENGLFVYGQRYLFMDKIGEALRWEQMTLYLQIMIATSQLLRKSLRKPVLHQLSANLRFSLRALINCMVDFLFSVGVHCVVFGIWELCWLTIRLLRSWTFITNLSVWWDLSSPKFMKRDVKNAAFRNVIEELKRSWKGKKYYSTQTENRDEASCPYRYQPLLCGQIQI